MAKGALPVNLLPVALFATGFLASIAAALLARLWLARSSGPGWVYLGAISVRVLVLLIGCTAIYLVVVAERPKAIAAFALGIAFGWVAHLVTALFVLRK